jgi:hypothetical protein
MGWHKGCNVQSDPHVYTLLPHLIMHCFFSKLVHPQFAR